MTPSCALDALPDERLAALTAAACPRAAAALLDRHRAALARSVRWWARAHHLPAADRDDALQEAALALLKAAGRYAAGDARAAPFRAFLRRAVRDRLSNWARSAARFEGHHDRGAQPAAALDGQAARSRPEGDGPGPPRSRAGDPVAAALWRESHAHLDHALSRLAPPLRRLWDRLCAGVSLRRLAGELGASLHHVRRQKRDLLHRLSAE
jgi:RNA polymerase sigma factor (sigma-70 family)